jgi:hypothetical protein
MPIRIIKLVIVCFYFCFGVVKAQDFENIKFGIITTNDFQISAPAFDSGANAVVIKDLGNTEYIGNESGFFSIVFKRFIRVKILNKNGFHAGDFEVLMPNYSNSQYAKIKDVKGSTFNLVNGAIQETTLDQQSIFTEKSNKYFDLVKFTMPALKEGSIFDLTYTQETTYFADPPDWSFQGNYPCLWSEYQATIPSIFHYYSRIKGNDSFDIKTSTSFKQKFLIKNGGGEIASHTALNVSVTSFQYRWVKKNVPVLKEQPFISDMSNYNSEISFELNYYQQDETMEKEFTRRSWDKISKDLLADESFGFGLNLDNNWMDDQLKNVTAGALSPEEEIRKIFDYVRTKFICTDHDDIYTQSSLKNVFARRSGNVAEINLLLVAMLRHRSITADPAILSTRSNGLVSPDDPMLQKYNYLICVARTGGKVYQLDASNSFNSFNKLPSYCYNGGTRIINVERPDYLILSTDSVAETRMTSAIFLNDSNGNSSGSVSIRFGQVQASDVREEIKKNSLPEYFKTLRNRLTNMNVSNEYFDSLNQADYPLVLHYDLDFKDAKSLNVIYLKPIQGSSFNTNPFEETQRLYPVEIPYKIDYTFVLTMEIPAGFQVDDLPKSARVSLLGTKGNFDYLIQQAGGSIQMRVHLKLNESTFYPDEYASLRDFFAFVVKKENEQIVFKRIQ